REEEERKRREEEERKRREEEERKRREEEERKRREEEKEDTTKIWEKLAKDTKSEIKQEAETAIKEFEKQNTESVSEDNEKLNEAISSLTLVRGISKDIAKALYKADITTIMELSLGNPEEIAAKSGLEISVVHEIIKNAKDILGFD
ncbi:MAG: hypothetical protein ACTSRL_11530, partial [Candidatus Helarchaeota archaeon]